MSRSGASGCDANFVASYVLTVGGLGCFSAVFGRRICFLEYSVSCFALPVVVGVAFPGKKRNVFDCRLSDRDLRPFGAKHEELMMDHGELTTFSLSPSPWGSMGLTGVPEEGGRTVSP